MLLPSPNDIEEARQIVYETMQPTPQISWPLLNERLGAEVWLKHENHTAVGAFKIRGALVYFRRLRESGADLRRVIAATRGNHGQAVAFAARREGLEPIVYVPRGNSVSKNRAMSALGAVLVEFGGDFEEARCEAGRRSAEEKIHFVPSFHPWLAAGAATYSYELLASAPPLESIYVPIGLGSGICGMCAAREALGLNTEIVGVVSADAPAYYESFLQGRPVEAPALTKLADGLACRVPDPAALGIIRSRVARVVTVTDDEIAAAIRALFDDTHNVAEGAGAAAIAALIQEKDRIRGKRVAAILSGGNIDRSVFARVLAAVHGR